MTKLYPYRWRACCPRIHGTTSCRRTGALGPPSAHHGPFLVQGSNGPGEGVAPGSTVAVQAPRQRWRRSAGAMGWYLRNSFRLAPGPQSPVSRPRREPLHLRSIAATGWMLRKACQPDGSGATLWPATRCPRHPEAKPVRHEPALASGAAGDRQRAREEPARIVGQDLGCRYAGRPPAHRTAAGPQDRWAVQGAVRPAMGPPGTAATGRARRWADLAAGGTRVGSMGGSRRERRPRPGATQDHPTEPASSGG